MTVFEWLLDNIPHTTMCREGAIPYLTRWYLLGKRKLGSRRPFNLYLHCFHSSDESTPHNHPFSWSASLILKGTYLEFRDGVCRWLRPGNINIIKRDDYHYVKLAHPVWTLFLAGPRVGGWGFQTQDGYVDAQTYIDSKPGAKGT